MQQALIVFFFSFFYTQLFIAVVAQLRVWDGGLLGFDISKGVGFSKVRKILRKVCWDYLIFGLGA